MGKAQRDKGYRGEINLVNYAKEQNLEAKRIPLSGAVEGFKGDVIIGGFTGEVKVRGNGFKKIYEWLADNDFLAVKADRRPYLVVLNLDTFLKLIKEAK